MPKLPVAVVAAAATAASPAKLPLLGAAPPQALVPAWLLSCYFLIVVLGGVLANVLLLVTTVRWRCGRRAGPRGTGRCIAAGGNSGRTSDPDIAADLEADADAGDSLAAVHRDRGWWFLVAQLAATDALALGLVSGGELWALRETGGPWRLPAALCTPFMGVEAMLGAAQTYLLVAIALHARTAPADPVPSLWRQVSRSTVVPSILIWMLASSVAVPRTFLAVAVWPRPSLPLCTLLPTSPTTGALEGPLDVVGPGPAGSWWPLGAVAVDGQGGGPLLWAVVLCAVPTLVLLATASASALAAVRGRGRGSSRPPSPASASVSPPHKLARREWVRVSGWLSLSWLLMSLPRLASAAVHGFLPPGPAPGGVGGGANPAAAMSFGPWAFRAPPLGSRALDDASLLAASMLHYALTAARPVLTALASPALRRAFAGLSLGAELFPDAAADSEDDGDGDGGERRAARAQGEGADILLDRPRAD